MRCQLQPPLAALRWLSLTLSLFVAATSLASVEGETNELIASASLGQARVSVMAVELPSGRTLIDINPDQPMIPASNMKLLTSATALAQLGPEFLFKTQLRLTDDGAGGKILIVDGDGDPGFGDPKILEQHDLDHENLLAAWVAAVQKTSARQISQIVVDDRVFDQQMTHPDWPRDQLNRWYCAQVAGLNFNDNCIDVYPSPTAIGQSPHVRLMPEADFYTTLNRAQTGDDDSFWISRKIGTNRLTFMGQVKHRRRTPIPVTVHDPPMWFGRLLSERLSNAGIDVGRVRRADPAEQLPPGKALHIVQTALPLVLKRCNTDSQGLFAEALLKRVGHALTGSPGSWRNGAAAVRIFLQERLGSQVAIVRVADGSGLSRNNRATARILVGLLVAMQQDPQLAEPWLESLAIAGVDGTMDDRLRDLNQRVLAKTGTIDGVSTISGYVLTRPTDDQPPRPAAAFSILVNDYKAPVHTYQIRALQDKIIRAIEDNIDHPQAIQR